MTIVREGRTLMDVTTWDLWVDCLRTDGEGLTHTSTRNVSPGVVLRIGEHVVVGNEDADLAVARVAAIGDDGVVLVAVLAGPAEAHRELVRDQPATT